MNKKEKSKRFTELKVMMLMLVLIVIHSAFGQSLLIKNSNNDTLITVIDEGEFGVLTIPPLEDGDPPPDPIDNKLYNRGGELYWGTNQLSLSSASGWTDDGGTIRLRSGADYVGIGTTSPTEKLDVNGNLNMTGILKLSGFAFLSNLGDYNLFVGQEAGIVNSGDKNTFVGYQSGYKNDTPSENTFIGYQSGTNTTTGQSNTFFGHRAGHGNTSDLYNTYIGYDAGFLGNNHENTFIGCSAGTNSNTGDNNTFIGINAGNSNSNGSYNLFCGSYAGNDNSIGTANVYIGTEAGRNNSDSNYNTFIGYNSGLNSSNGGHVFIGFESGKNETGSNKLYIENSDSDTPLIGGDFSANKIYLNGKVGIGTDSPDEKFEIEFGSENIDFEIGQGETSTNLTFLALRNPDGNKYYVFVNPSGSITTQTGKP